MMPFDYYKQDASEYLVFRWYNHPRFVPAVVLGIAALWLVGRIPSNLPGLVSLLLTSPIKILSLIALVFPFIAAPTITLLLMALGFSMIPFGAELALACLSLHVTAEATPPGTWSLVVLAPTRGITLSSDAALQHSTHSDPDALLHLKKWLMRHFCSEPGTGVP
jgi:hypothetical protein